MTERISAQKANILALCDMGVRKTYLYEYVADSLRTTEGEPTQIRRAKAFADVLDRTEAVVLPHELITGSMLGICPVWGKSLPESEQNTLAEAVIAEYLKKKKAGSARETVSFGAGHAKSFEDDFTSKKSRWSLMSRVHHDASVEYKDLQRLIALMCERFAGEDIEKYEIGRELERAFKIDYNSEHKQAYNDLPYFIGNHLSLNYAKMAGKGFETTRKEIVSHLEVCDSDEKREYYESALIALDASVRFCKKYASALRACAENEDAARRSELLALANICDRISEERANSFYEALQFMWMLHIIASIQGGSALSFGRFDVDLYPYYIKDKEVGLLTDDMARELISCIFLKINEPKMRTVQSITLGGTEYNELTRICLEAARDVAMPYPNIGLRVNKDTPKWVYETALDTIGAGCGQPMIMNDGVWCDTLVKLGYTRGLAERYYNMGCVEIMIPGKQPSWGVTEAIAFPVMLETVFSKYRRGEIKINSFDELFAAYLFEIDRAIERDVEEARGKRENMRGKCYDPFSSLLIDGCIENGCDMLQDGCECPMHWAVYAYGIGTAADSLAATKKFVFDEKRLSLDELVSALEANFAGYESLRGALMAETPRYGNRDDAVDAIAARILDHYSRSVLAQNGKLGRDRFVSTLFGYFFHIYHGEIAGATPDGRLRGEPFSDSMGPGQGRDVKGPTRLLGSVLKLDTSNVTGGYALNFKITPSFCKEKKGREALIALLRAYIRHGGPQIQIYTTNADDLKDALIHPELHRDLIVRVGGYCEFFVNLDRALQEEIVKRTVYGDE